METYLKKIMDASRLLTVDYCICELIKKGDATVARGDNALNLLNKNNKY